MNQTPFFKKSNSRIYPRRNDSNLPRKNKQIRAREVRVIGPDGKQIGVLSIQAALDLAASNGLDLVEISPKTQPPVCKILDFGKYKYEEGKKNKGQKSTAAKLKEIKLGASIEKNDYLTKLRHAEEFLYKGNKVKLYLMLKGRQMGNPELAMDVVKRMADDLKEVGVKDAPPVKSGRNISVLLSPLPTSKRVLVYNRKEEEESNPT